MKKIHVMELVSATRRKCEIANACLRSTANTYDRDLMQVRPTTEEERVEAIMQAWLWAHDASTAAKQASSAALEYAKQNGVTIAQLDEYVEGLRQAA